jgi:hypothetical protein
MPLLSLRARSAMRRRLSLSGARLSKTPTEAVEEAMSEIAFSENPLRPDL